MNIDQAYKLLNIAPSASDEDVTKSYKRLAMQFHPDRNRERIEWATETMARVNNAYSEVMAFRFRRGGAADASESETADEDDRFKNFRDSGDASRKPEAEKRSAKNRKPEAVRPGRDELIERFARVKDAANSSLYKFFQYNLYNMVRRDSSANMAIFNRMVKTLRRGYHACIDLEALTDDPELKGHFMVYREMLYHFYRASECVNVIDSYKSQRDVDAYREYKKGEDCLHLAHREIFYERHNRGAFRGGAAMSELLKAESMLTRALQRYSDSSWAVETKIKLDYVTALKQYLRLFFSE